MPTSHLARSLGCALALAIAWLCVASPSLAADAVDHSAFDVTADTTLDDLVAPIALYPDDLLAIMVPASAYPLDVVQASRFVDKLKTNKDLKPDENWDESVRNLINTPDVVQLMATNLDWTIRLGEEVAEDQAAVMNSIQAFRRQVDAAGNLESDDKQKIVAEEDTIRIELSNPEVIYVPQYNPQVVVVPAPLPPIRYYPTPYPVYYYPYPPGAAFATGFFFGATTAFAFSWGAHAIHHGVHGYRGRGYRGGHNDININRNVDRSRNTNVNVKNVDKRGSTNIKNNKGNRGGGGSEWKPKNKGGQRTGSKISKPQNRAGGAGYKPRNTGGGNRATTGAGRNPSKKVNTGGSYNRTGSGASRDKASNRASSGSRNRASSANRSSSGHRSSASRSGSSGHRSGSFSGRSSGGHRSSYSSSRGHSSRGGGGHRGGGGGRGGGGRRR